MPNTNTSKPLTTEDIDAWCAFAKDDRGSLQLQAGSGGLTVDEGDVEVDDVEVEYAGDVEPGSLFDSNAAD